MGRAPVTSRRTINVPDCLLLGMKATCTWLHPGSIAFNSVLDSIAFSEKVHRAIYS